MPEIPRYYPSEYRKYDDDYDWEPPDPDDRDYQLEHEVQDALLETGMYDEPPLICSPAESMFHGDVYQAMESIYGKGALRDL